ncbi:MAG: hypothetical protein A4S09_05060 [Proteobacteria bacterium SG_bin7]|nr:MAG: hypothetical protein A4S09_05060 [Proteobacteria bacterium SG_bin7]
MGKIRKALWGVVLILILVNISLEIWHRGYDTGYSAAMSDVVLQIETPENFFIKKFDIKVPKRVEQ